MSITIGVCARMGPCPSSCGSTAWSPGAQMVCAGTQPRAMIRSLTAERRSSAVKRRPSRRSQPSRPMRVARSAARPASSPASAARSAAWIARTSSGRFLSRSGQNGSGPRSRRMPRASSSMARPSEKLRGTSTRRIPRPRSARAITAAGVALPPAASSALARADHDRTSSTRGLGPRAIPLEVAHDEDAPPAHLDEQERVGREEAGRVQDVGVGLGGGVEEARDGAAARAHRASRARHEPEERAGPCRPGGGRAWRRGPARRRRHRDGTA